MLESVRQLAERYRQLLPSMKRNYQWYEQFSQSIASLTLAEVLLIKLREGDSAIRHVVIMGPTQSGKSTLANALLPEPLAEASALAGFTIHPQAFFQQKLDHIVSQLQVYFPNYDLQDLALLSRNNTHQVGFKTYTQPSLLNATNDVLLWDSPDFDSVDAAGYSESVLRAIALGDVLVLIVSKEKYADQRVWDVLTLIAPLDKELIVCINKTREADTAILKNSFERRYAEVFAGKTLPAVLMLPFVESDQLPVTPVLTAINNSVANSIKFPGAAQMALENFISLHQTTWLAPLQQEQQSHLAWEERQAHEQSLFSKRYRQEYLDHPHYYDTFQRALAELLKLLEVPGLGGKLAQARELITWPVRTLVKHGKGVFKREEKATGKDLDYEANLIQQLADHYLTRMIDLTLQQAQVDSPSVIWQQALASELNQSRAKILRQLDRAVEEYQADFENEIQLAADRLYEQLQRQPALLNGLRAARVSMDAAAVVFALKSGGISMNDFILAPAMLSLSSMLMESSLGQYLNKVKAELKVLQNEQVSQLVNTQLIAEVELIRQRVLAEKAFNLTASFGESTA